MEELATSAERAYRDGHYSDAQRMFEDILKFNLNNGVRERCMVNVACCLAAQDNHQAALDMLKDLKLNSCIEALYNQALCEYRLAHFPAALKLVDEMINQARILFPRLTSPSDSESNSLQRELEASCLIEAVNLKAAAQYKMDRDSASARSHLECLPFKDMYEFDFVTLHNHAIFSCTQNMDLSINALAHLADISTKSAPSVQKAGLQETIFNYLILLYASGRDEVASSFLANQTALVSENLDPDVGDLLKSEIRAADESTIRDLERLIDSALSRDRLERTSNSASMKPRNYILVAATLLGSIFWRQNQFAPLERLFSKINSTLTSNAIWKTNWAHFNFIQDTRFESCCELYESLLPDSVSSNLTCIDPMILANLCVAYVLTGRNTEAEELIKDVESDEFQAAEVMKSQELEILSESTQQIHKFAHISMINLVIGTLYCVKHNFEFGLSRIFKSVQPIDLNLNYWKWFHVKRCILYLLECHCKQLVLVSDELFDRVVTFLKQCEEEGAALRSTKRSSWSVQGYVIDRQVEASSLISEARYLRAILLPIIHD